jgi:pyruvate dehydrogenase E1 component alpha subunit
MPLRIITAARNGMPGFLTLTCYRHFGHARLDKSPYRDEAEEREGRKRDAVANARHTLLARGTAGEQDLEIMDRTIEAEMNAAVDHAVAALPPPVDTMFRDVFAEGEPRPRPLRQHLSMILGEAR